MSLPLYNEIFRRDVVSVRTDKIVYSAEFIGYYVMDDTIGVGPLTVAFDEIKSVSPTPESAYIRAKTFIPRKEIKSISIVWQHPLNLELKNSITELPYLQEAPRNPPDSTSIQ